MEKLKMQSHDVIGSNTQKIARLFPNCVTERLGKDGKPELAIDFEKLQAELSNEIIAEGEERYQFTWPDKRASVRLANTPTTMTLRPCREESVDFDNTQNLYIEGDNLDVLKVLRETYLGKVKMIYIDPPYNTGNDFVYNDDFAQGKDDFEQSSGFFDEEGNQTIDPMQRNTESNGRFHTDWLNMIYPRLKVARDLLTEDGVIFISIDDNEGKNLKNITDEIFGEHNFLAQVVWERSFAPISLKKHFSYSHDYILAYGKNIDITVCNGLPRTEENTSRYSNPDNDQRGPWQSDNTTVGPVVNSKVYPLTLPSGRVILPPSGRCWLYTKERFQEMIADNRIWFGANGDNVPRLKRFLSEVKQGVTPMSIWKHEEVGHSQQASQALKLLFGGKSYFEYPKPVDLIQRCLALYTNYNDIILDFFSGSATTAHAVMKLNAEDGGNRRFIMVQLPEKTDEKSEAYKAGYKNICEIGKERIRRAGRKIKEESAVKNEDLAVKLDTGFRVLKLDSSNMEDVYYTPQDFSLQSLFNENVKADRTNEDLLFQVMLDLGIELSAKIESKQIAGKTVHFVDDNYLVACFDNNVNETAITEIAKLKPVYFVMRDSSAANDNVIDNFEQIFKHYSPDTTCRVI
ncbi:MAG: site-specific DNA-methyltransferase [Paludibacteraceae bacterium]|nr:site-specific DNA-methyltransferase [Paludibacteraceae bacterium]